MSTRLLLPTLLGLSISCNGGITVDTQGPSIPSTPTEPPITEADLPNLVVFLETLNDVPNAAFRKLIIDAEVLDTSAGFDEARVPRERKRPNVVTLLADDLGWKDLGCYGGEIDTDGR